MIAFASLIALALLGLTAAIPIESPTTDQHQITTTAKPLENAKVIVRRQLDITGGSVVYDNSDSAVIPLSGDGDSVAVYEIIPREVYGRQDDGQYVSNLLSNAALGAEEEQEASVVSADGDDDDMAVAETHVFRPLFRYRAVQDDRRRRRIDYDY